MTEKLLEKSRNIFLSLTPQENLIPKKRVKASKKKCYQKNSIKNSRRLYVSVNSLNKFFPEKSQPTTLVKGSANITRSKIYFSSRTPRALQDGRRGCNLSLENKNRIPKNIIPPRNHSAQDELHSFIGGNIYRFLKIQHHDERKNKELSTRAGEAEFLYLEKNSGGFPFSLRWNQESFSFTNFIKAQLHENIWNSLFSSYDLNNVYNIGVKNYKAPIRIKNQHKNELMEYRKIAILYGNLSRNALTCLMKRSGGSKFLSTLERRLDVTLKRALFFPTIRAARQWIHQGKILVNNELCLYNSHLLQPGDLISIKETDKKMWRKEWFKHFGGFLYQGNTHIHQKETFPETFPDSRDSFVRPRERFLFPPHLMRKWYKWCQLWGNSISRGKDSHQWSKHNYTWNFSLHGAFNASVSANNLYLKSFMQLKSHLHKLMYTRRQSTPILFWLGELYRNSPLRRERKHYMYQLISGLLLLQIRGRVIDGLFPQRWNRLFTKKKRYSFKKKGLQWGGIKPMHLECSYSCATVIYLFTPQKLVWPSHINVLLLKSALDG